MVRAGELGSDDLSAWRDWRARDPALASPFYDPAFTSAVAAAGGEVRIIVVDGTSFWPVQFDRNGIAGPVGLTLNDYQGVIGPLASGVPGDSRSGSDGGSRPTPATVLRAAGIRRFRFDHLPASQAYLRSGASISGRHRSPYLDLGAGFGPYEAELRSQGSNLVAKTRTRQRWLERDIGPVRFTVHDPEDAEAYDALRRWKSAQYRATGVRDLFSAASERRAIELLRECRQPGCGLAR